MPPLGPHAPHQAGQLDTPIHPHQSFGPSTGMFGPSVELYAPSPSPWGPPRARYVSYPDAAERALLDAVATDGLGPGPSLPLSPPDSPPSFAGDGGWGPAGGGPERAERGGGGGSLPHGGSAHRGDGGAGGPGGLESLDASLRDALEVSRFLNGV